MSPKSRWPLPRPTPQMTRDAAALHDRLHAWLLENCGADTDVMTVLGALTYEIGLCAGKISEGIADEAIDQMLDGIRDGMRQQISAYRKGLRS